MAGRREHTQPRLAADKMPQIVVPTTPTTAIPWAGSAMLDEASARMALFDPKTRARSVFQNPVFTASAPLVAAQRGSNSLALAVEGLLSRMFIPCRTRPWCMPPGLYRSLARGGGLASPAERRDLIWYAIQAGRAATYILARHASPSARDFIDIQYRQRYRQRHRLPHVVRFNAPSAGLGIELLEFYPAGGWGAARMPSNVAARALTQPRLKRRTKNVHSSDG